MVWGSNSGMGEIFRNRPDQPWGPPSLLYNGYWVFPRGKERPECDPLLPLWTVWSVQNPSACTRVRFTFTFTIFKHSYTCNGYQWNFYLFMHTVFYIAPACFGIIILPSLGRWQINFFNTYSKKIGHNKRTYTCTYMYAYCDLLHCCMFYRNFDVSSLKMAK